MTADSADSLQPLGVAVRPAQPPPEPMPPSGRSRSRPVPCPRHRRCRRWASAGRSAGRSPSSRLRREREALLQRPGALTRQTPWARSGRRRPGHAGRAHLRLEPPMRRARQRARAVREPRQSGQGAGGSGLRIAQRDVGEQPAPAVPDTMRRERMGPTAQRARQTNSGYTRAQPRAEYIAARDEVRPMTAEHAGSGHFAHAPSRDALRTCCEGGSRVWLNRALLIHFGVLLRTYNFRTNMTSPPTHPPGRQVA